MNVRSGLGVVVLCLISVSLTGCIRIQPVDPDLTVEKAKADVLAEGKRMVSLISEGLVEEYQQLDTTHLLSCTSDSYTWSDQGEVTFKGDPDIPALVTLIAEDYRSRSGFSVKNIKRWDGGDRVVISGDNGANYYLTVGSKGILQVDSFSACFTLDDDQWPGDEY